MLIPKYLAVYLISYLMVFVFGLLYEYVLMMIVLKTRAKTDSQRAEKNIQRMRVWSLIKGLIRGFITVIMVIKFISYWNLSYTLFLVVMFLMMIQSLIYTYTNRPKETRSVFVADDIGSMTAMMIIIIFLAITN
jgi:hypothetical protein